MFEAVLTLAAMSLVAIVFSSGRKHRTPVPEDAKSVEVFRAEKSVAEQALHMLCDGGVPAWTEVCDDKQLAIHVEEQDIPMVRHVLQEAGLQHA